MSNYNVFMLRHAFVEWTTTSWLHAAFTNELSGVAQPPAIEDPSVFYITCSCSGQTTASWGHAYDAWAIELAHAVTEAWATYPRLEKSATTAEILRNIISRTGWSLRAAGEFFNRSHTEIRRILEHHREPRDELATRILDTNAIILRLHGQIDQRVLRVTLNRIKKHIATTPGSYDYIFENLHLLDSVYNERLRLDETRPKGTGNQRRQGASH